MLELDRWAVERARRLQQQVVAVFTDIRRVESLLNDLRREWLPRNRDKGYPISIVVTGLIDDAHGLCRKTGFKEHRYLHCLGPFGRQARQLPSGDEFSIITMCGHGLIAKNRVRNLVRLIQKGEMTPEQAAEDIARPCQCGIGNKKRAQELFARLAKAPRSG